MTHEEIQAGIDECHKTLDLIMIGRYALTIHNWLFGILYYPDNELPRYILSIHFSGGSIGITNWDGTKTLFFKRFWKTLSNQEVWANTLIYLVTLELGIADYKNHKKVRRDPVKYVNKYCSPDQKRMVSRRTLELENIMTSKDGKD